MPKGGKKGKKRNGHINLSCTDIKLADYANNCCASVVRRKPAVNSLVREVKSLCNLERSWYEQDIEEFENLETDNCESLIVYGKRKSSRTKIQQSDNQNDSHGLHYPVDLWFLIAKYIKPEDVKVFASLCKTSHLVSQTYTFWIGMYKRFYKAEKQLPLRLQPQCIERPFSLKASVIRALYHFYPHFVNQMSPQLSPSREVYKLVKLLCVSMWRVQTNGKWFFYFKFKSLSSCTNTDDVVEKEPNVWTYWDTTSYNDSCVLLRDVNLNPDDGCRILQVTSPHFVAAPVVMGSYLADVRVSLARDMTRQKLQLYFSFSSYKQKYKNAPSIGSRECGGSGEIIEFDPVENMSVFNWWHPQYPSGNKF